MDNDKLREKLSAYFDNELSEAERVEIERYIAQSEEAQRIVREFELLDQMAQSEKLSAGGDYWEQMASRIDQAIESSPESETEPMPVSWWNSWGWKAVSVAASLVLMTFFGLHQSEIVDRSIESRVDQVEQAEEKAHTPEGDGLSEPEDISAGVIESERIESVPETDKAKPKPELVEEEVDEMSDLTVGREKPAAKIGLPTPVVIAPAKEEIEIVADKRSRDNLGITTTSADIEMLSIPIEKAESRSTESYWQIWESEIVPTLAAVRAKGIDEKDSVTSLSRSMVSELSAEKPKKMDQSISSQIADSVGIEDSHRRINAAYYVAQAGDSTQVRQAIGFIEHIAREGGPDESEYARDMLRRLDVGKSDK